MGDWVCGLSDCIRSRFYYGQFEQTESNKQLAITIHLIDGL